MAGKSDGEHSDSIMIRISGELAWLLKQAQTLPVDSAVKTELRQLGEDCNRCSVLRSLLDQSKVARLRQDVGRADAARKGGN